MSTFRVLLRLLPLVAFPLACSSEDPSPDEPRQVVTAMLAGAVVGIPYQQPLEADCPAGSPPVWGITTGGLPPGLTIQGSLIVGTPTQEGAFSFTVIVTCHGTGTRALSLAVAPAADLAITIPDASGTLPPGRIGVPYQVQLTAAGNRSGAISWTIRPGSALPPGLDLSTTGMITGTPQGLPGTADFTLNGQAFRLQNYYVKDFAENFMVKIGVDDVEAWHERARQIADSGEFEGVRIKPPEPVENFLVLHVIDPAGVLLVFVETLPKSA